MFKFNFGDDDDDDDGNSKGEKSKTDDGASPNCDGPSKKSRAQAKEHFLDECHLEKISGAKLTIAEGIRILDNVPEEPVGDCDLVPGVYEGGFKIWECSYDLAEFLSDQNFSGRSVLELGCGAGLPGLACFARGGQVHFQDYNESVIESLTMPNLLLNIPDGETPETRFFSGDWGELLEVLPPESYDLVVTSETIYDLSSQPNLLTLIDRCLKTDGKALVAAKIHYFGVGGGLRQFEEKVLKMRKWSVKTVKTVETGVKREILQLERLPVEAS